MSSHNFRGESSRSKKKPQKQMYRPVPRPVPSQKPPPTPPPIKIRPAILFWDGDNCKIPTSQPPVSASDLPQNVLCLLKLFNISCHTLNVKLVGDMTQMAKVKSELSNVVKPTDIYNVPAAKTSPNASDYKLMALMVDWIQKNPNNPTTVIIASSDGDFARIANMIRQKNHLVVVLCHRRVSSQFLKGAADLVCDWQKVACGNRVAERTCKLKSYECLLPASLATLGMTGGTYMCGGSTATAHCPTLCPVA